MPPNLTVFSPKPVMACEINSLISSPISISPIRVQYFVVAPVVNKIDSALSPGRVVCTELALAGDISMEKYSEVIQPAITLRGRILLGYHVLGVPAVRKLRSSSKFRKAAIPYVNAYLDHKLGKWNLTGFLIKSIGEPLCYLLSFVNTDPDYYKVLYPYRRNSNGS